MARHAASAAILFLSGASVGAYTSKYFPALSYTPCSGETQLRCASLLISHARRIQTMWFQCQTKQCYCRRSHHGGVCIEHTIHAERRKSGGEEES